jgi:sulfatase maturation enzyme AslB (radical SAM superfamily)
MENVRYGFYGRLTEKFPSQIIVDATEMCNLACIHCPHPDFKKSAIYTGAKLELELNQKMVDEVRNYGKGSTQYIRYTSNGEPLIHPNIFDMLKYAKEYSGTYVTLTTNGRLLKGERLEKLLGTNIDLVDISIDAYKEETYSQIRVGGKLQETRTNVINLIQAKNKNSLKMKVIVSFVEQPQNTKEVSDFEKFWKDQGADYVVIRRLHSAAGAVESVKNTMWNSITTEPRKPCVYPWERILLNPTGWLAFCPTDWIHGSLVVDYRTTTIYETWNGEFYRKLREAHLCNNFENHKFCGECPDWAVIKWPDEGRAYADMISEFKREGAEFL